MLDRFELFHDVLAEIRQESNGFTDLKEGLLPLRALLMRYDYSARQADEDLFLTPFNRLYCEMNDDKKRILLSDFLCIFALVVFDYNYHYFINRGREQVLRHEAGVTPLFDPSLGLKLYMDDFIQFIDFLSREDGYEVEPLSKLRAGDLLAELHRSLLNESRFEVIFEKIKEAIDKLYFRNLNFENKSEAIIKSLGTVTADSRYLFFTPSESNFKGELRELAGLSAVGEVKSTVFVFVNNFEEQKKYLPSKDFLKVSGVIYCDVNEKTYSITNTKDLFPLSNGRRVSLDAFKFILAKILTYSSDTGTNEFSLSDIPQNGFNNRIKGTAFNALYEKSILSKDLKISARDCNPQIGYGGTSSGEATTTRYKINFPYKVLFVLN